MNTGTLPQPFEYLAPWLEWALPTEAGRMQKRLDASMTQLTTFYNILLPRMEEIVAYLDQWELHEIPADSKPLLYLALMFMEAAVCVELFKDPDVPESLPAAKMKVFSEQTEQALLANSPRP
ncbi:MAG: hypothetical protein VX663_11560 [Pseudomonadota bacterium]|nr:hypothetical protein [Pseudomonadota bacterium]